MMGQFPRNKIFLKEINMKKLALLLFALFCHFLVSAQGNDTWNAFYNQDSTKIGFKDQAGNVKIEPKFVGMFGNQKFENIIAVYEETGPNWKTYYLTKAGKQVGYNNLYMFDNTQDCEYEGFIRFTDKKTDKTGLFDKDGNIAIPADYNYVSKVRNGLVVVLKGAKKKYKGEHFFWKGGKNYLLDVKNNELIENFKTEEDLNFYSLEISKTPSKDPIRESFLAKDGTYYTFIDYRKEFYQWFLKDFIPNISLENLYKNSLDTFQIWNEEKSEWIKVSKKEFIANNFDALKKNFQSQKIVINDYYVSVYRLDSLMYEGAEFEKYFDNCAQGMDQKFPLITVLINNIISGTLVNQNKFDFLRTENGYKLVQANIEFDDLK